MEYFPIIIFILTGILLGSFGIFLFAIVYIGFFGDLIERSLQIKRTQDKWKKP